MATDLGKGTFWIQTSCTPLKNDLVSNFAHGKGDG